MLPILAQDWVTVKNATSTSPITQSEPGWLELRPYQHLVTWLEVTEVSTSSGSLFIAFETAPSKDESLFQSMNDTTIAIPAGVTTTVLTKEAALSPLSRWFRWRLFPTGGVTTWDITFRLWITVDGSMRVGGRRSPQPADCGCAKG
jgi:hypothetical protein